MPPALAPELVREIARLRADGHTVDATAAILGIGTTTVDRYWNHRHPVRPHPPRPPAPTQSWISDWHDDAACRRADPDKFDTLDPAKARAAAAEYCARCPALADCYRWAERATEYEGVAGGALWTPRVRARRKKAA